MALKSDKNKSEDGLEFLLKESLKAKKIKEIEALARVKRQRVNRNYLYGIAASVLLLIGVGLAYQQVASRGPEAIASKYIADVNIAVDIENTRSFSDAEPGGVWLKKAEAAMTEKDYPKAVLYFGKYEEISPLSKHDKLNYALVILNTKGADFNKSKEVLKSIGEVESGIKVEALYLLGLNEVLLGNDKAAIQAFNQLNEITDYRKDEVNTILKKLNQ